MMFFSFLGGVLLSFRTVPVYYRKQNVCSKGIGASVLHTFFDEKVCALPSQNGVYRRICNDISGAVHGSSCPAGAAW